MVTDDFIAQLILAAYKHGNDIVTHLPPKWLGYALPSSVVEKQIGVPSKRWPNIRDHGIDHYLREIALLEAGI